MGAAAPFGRGLAASTSACSRAASLCAGVSVGGGARCALSASPTCALGVATLQPDAAL